MASSTISMVGSAGGLVEPGHGQARCAVQLAEQDGGRRVELLDALVDHEEDPFGPELDEDVGQRRGRALAEADLDREVVAERGDDVHEDSVGIGRLRGTRGRRVRRAAPGSPAGWPVSAPVATRAARSVSPRPPAAPRCPFPGEDVGGVERPRHFGRQPVGAAQATVGPALQEVELRGVAPGGFELRHLLIRMQEVGHGLPRPGRRGSSHSAHRLSTAPVVRPPPPETQLRPAVPGGVGHVGDQFDGPAGPGGERDAGGPDQVVVDVATEARRQHQSLTVSGTVSAIEATRSSAKASLRVTSGAR